MSTIDHDELSHQIGELNTTIGYQDAMLKAARKALDAAQQALLSYAHGNSAPDLAREVADMCRETIGQITKGSDAC